MDTEERRRVERMIWNCAVNNCANAADRVIIHRTHFNKPFQASTAQQLRSVAAIEILKMLGNEPPHSELIGG